MRVLRSLGCVFTLSILIFSPGFAASQNFKVLKYMLGSRSQEPKIYLPTGVVLGKDLKITVMAPGAKAIKLLSSLEEGETEFEGHKLKLGADLKEVETQNTERADFSIPLDPSIYTDHTGKKLFFEALAYYEDPVSKQTISRPVSFYGSNASMSVTNSVQILAVPKDNSSLAASARALMPGLNRPNY